MDGWMLGHDKCIWVECIQEGMHPGKNASRGDLVLQPLGQVALLS